MPSKPIPFGRFVLQRELKDTGEHSKLYLAIDGEKYGPVIVKIPTGRDPAELVRFRHEMEMSVQLRHRHLITALEGGEVAGVPYLVLEWIRGRSAALLAQTAGKHSIALRPEIAAGIMLQALEGLAYAQSFTKLAFVHRDISPDNIMVSYKGTAKLIDYGLSKSSEKPLQTMPGMITGTIGYIAPEQIRSAAPASPTTDVYSMGAVLWHLLTYAPPPDWTQPRSFEKIAQRLQERKVPELLQAVVQKALQPAPHRRYKNAAEMGQALAACRVAREVDVGKFISALFSGARTATEEEYAELDRKSASATHKQAVDVARARPVWEQRKSKSSIGLVAGAGALILGLAAFAYWGFKDSEETRALAIAPMAPLDLTTSAEDFSTTAIDLAATQAMVAAPAIAVVEPAVSKHTTHSTADSRLVELEAFFQKGNFAPAKKLCGELEKEPQIAAQAFYLCGKIYFQEQDYQKAYAAATRSLKKGGYDRALLLRADAAARLYKWDSAAADFSAYLKKHPDSQEARQGLELIANNRQ